MNEFTDITFFEYTSYSIIHLSKLLVHWLAEIEPSLHRGAHVGSIRVSVYKSVFSLWLSIAHAHREIGSKGLIKKVRCLAGLLPLDDTID